MPRTATEREIRRLPIDQREDGRQVAELATLQGRRADRAVGRMADREQRSRRAVLLSSDGAERGTARVSEREYAELRRRERDDVLADDLLSRLRPETEAAIRLHVMDGMTYDQVAAALGITPGQARARVRRGMAHMRAVAERG